MSIKINRIGNRYGMLSVISEAENNKRGQARWFCKCDCGSYSTVEACRLANGMTKSCGCLKRSIGGKNKKDLLGIRFGKLVVISAEKSEKNYAVWKVRCDCGTIKNVRGVNLSVFNTKSCGCERIRPGPSNNYYIHGKTKTHAYWLRQLAKQRAIKKNVPFDISIEDVEEIISEMKCFYLGVPLKKNQGKLTHDSLTLDRVIPNLGYVKGNVVACSHRANTIKNTASVNDLEIMIKALRELLPKT
jgi:hypothetical protein